MNELKKCTSVFLYKNVFNKLFFFWSTVPKLNPLTLLKDIIKHILQSSKKSNFSHHLNDNVCHMWAKRTNFPLIAFYYLHDYPAFPFTSLPL